MPTEDAERSFVVTAVVTLSHHSLIANGLRVRRGLTAHLCSNTPTTPHAAREALEASYAAIHAAGAWTSPVTRREARRPPVLYCCLVGGLV